MTGRVVICFNEEKLSCQDLTPFSRGVSQLVSVDLERAERLRAVG